MAWRSRFLAGKSRFVAGRKNNKNDVKRGARADNRQGLRTKEDISEKKWPNTLSREFTNIYFTQLDVAISEPDMYIALTIVVSPLSWA